MRLISREGVAPSVAASPGATTRRRVRSMGIEPAMIPRSHSSTVNRTILPISTEDWCVSNYPVKWPQKRETLTISVVRRSVGPSVGDTNGCRYRCENTQRQNTDGDQLQSRGDLDVAKQEGGHKRGRDIGEDVGGGNKVGHVQDDCLTRGTVSRLTPGCGDGLALEDCHWP